MLAVSQTVPPVHAPVAPAAQMTQLLLESQACKPLGHSVVLPLVQSTHAPLPAHTFPLGHSVSFWQPRHALLAQTGCVPVHKALEEAVHSTQVFDPEHAGTWLLQLCKSAAVHSTHAPELAQASPPGQLPPLHATHATPSQTGVLPLH